MILNTTTYTVYYDPNGTLPDKLSIAAGGYFRKHGRKPTIALLHPDDLSPFLPGVREVVGDYILTLNSAPFVSPGMIYVGIEDAKEDQTEMSTATVDQLLDQAMDEHAKPYLDESNIKAVTLSARGKSVTLTRTRDEIAADLERIKADMEANPAEKAPAVEPFMDAVDAFIEEEVAQHHQAQHLAEVKAQVEQEFGIHKTADTTIVLRAPGEMDFFGADFLADPHLQRLADTLCATHNLAAAKGAVTVLWKRKGGTSGGKHTLGKCLATSSGLLGFYVPTAFHVWLAADHCRAHQLNPKQIEALVYHELSHVGLACDEKTGECVPVIVAHEFAGFHRELEIYGLWNDTLATAKASFEQARLW